MLQIIKDLDHGYWLGTPWLVIEEEGEPAVASFKTEAEALAHVAEESAADEAELMDPERWDGMS